MKLSECKSVAILVLMRDVTNPRPDRRKVRSFDALPTWKAGTRLMLKTNKLGAHIVAQGLYGLVQHHELGFSALLDACEAAPRTLENVLWAAQESYAYTAEKDVLASLIEMRLLTLEDVEAAIAHHAAKGEAP